MARHTTVPLETGREQSGLLFSRAIRPAFHYKQSQPEQTVDAHEAHVSSADITVTILIIQGCNAAVERNLQVFSRTGSNRQVPSVH